jgi:hypothetical protein
MAQVRRDLLEELKRVEHRVQFLEFCLEQRPSSSQHNHPSLLRSLVSLDSDPEKTPEDVKRVQKFCLQVGLKVAMIVQVPEHYYETPLSERREFVKAPSEEHLCKTILLENTKCTRSDCSDPKNSRWYAVIIQYTT